MNAPNLPQPTEASQKVVRDVTWIVAALVVVVLSHLFFSFWHRWDYGFDLE